MLLFTKVSQNRHAFLILTGYDMAVNRNREVITMTNTAYMTEKIFFALGTVCSLTVYDGDVYKALKRSKDRVMEIHRRMNAYDENSEISQINVLAGEGFVRISDDTMKLIEDSAEYSARTNGLFDITTRPVSRLWKTAVRSGMLPLPYEVDRSAALTGYRDVLIDHDHSAVMLRRKGQEIDLGAIAKGYAADEVRRIFIEEGVTQAIINLGGTVINLGKNRRIGIRNPFTKTNTPFAYVEAGEKAVVTSGLYEQGAVIDGKYYHHIIHPKTGYPSDFPLAGITLIGDSAEELDALSTSAFMMEIADAVRFLQMRDIEAVFVTKERQIFTTNGLNGSYANAG